MPEVPIKSRLASGGVVLGTMAFEFPSPGLARIVANAGAEFLILDMEHSGWGFETIKAQLATLGMDAFSGTPEELGKFVNEQLVLWERLIRDAGIEKQ